MNRFFTLLLVIILSIVSHQMASAKFEFAYDKYANVVKVYPNPIVSDAIISIDQSVDISNAKVSVTFYNLIGSEVYKLEDIKDYQVKIDKNDLKSKGILIYQLRIDNKIITTGRVTVK